VIEALKDAFVQGRLTRDELGARAGRALAAWTSAELAALTADIPAGAGMSARPTAPVRRWPLARAAAGSGGCLLLAFAAAWVGGHTDHPLGPSPYKSWMTPGFFVALVALAAALGVVSHGVGTSMEQRRSRRQLPPRPGPGGRALDGGQRGSGGYGPVPPAPPTAWPAPACGLTGRSSAGGTFPPERAGHCVAPDRRQPRYDAGETGAETGVSGRPDWACVLAPPVHRATWHGNRQPGNIRKPVLRTSPGPRLVRP
jgi:hypothetical protein